MTIVKTIFTGRRYLTLRVISALLLAAVLLLGTGAFQSQVSAESIPLITITKVEKDSLVTIETTDFPANRTFIVRMGKSGTKGVDGIEVGTTFSGSGGSFSAVYSIPAELKGQAIIAIRLEATSGGSYRYNWFWNNPGAVIPSSPSYSGIPTIAVSGVVKNNTVTIKTHNFPANRTFIVRMGVYGSLGVGGFQVGTTASGSGGTFVATYQIPDGLKSQSRIAIRLDSTTGGFSAWNWFWNK